MRKVRLAGPLGGPRGDRIAKPEAAGGSHVGGAGGRSARGFDADAATFQLDLAAGEVLIGRNAKAGPAARSVIRGREVIVPR